MKSPQSAGKLFPHPIGVFCSLLKPPKCHVRGNTALCLFCIFSYKHPINSPCGLYVIGSLLAPWWRCHLRQSVKCPGFAPPPAALRALPAGGPPPAALLAPRPALPASRLKRCCTALISSGVDSAVKANSASMSSAEASGPCASAGDGSS